MDRAVRKARTGCMDHTLSTKEYLRPQAVKNADEILMPIRLSASLSVCLLALICECLFEVPLLCSD